MASHPCGDVPFRRRQILLLSIQSNSRRYHLSLFNPSSGAQWFSTGTESARTEFNWENAYEVLGVSETSSFAEIKASFHKLAKETHPDLAESKTDSDASRRFVQILAAYEILSDCEKRAHYDMDLLSQRKLMQKHSGRRATLTMYKRNLTTYKQMEVVEWLKWYRLAINDVLSERKVVVGTDYFDVLERDFYSAIHAAYYGPLIESMDLLPDCFEAEERSVYETPEVLHLVSGRDLFGMVCLANKVPELSHSNKKLNYFTSAGLGICQSVEDLSVSMKSGGADDVGNAHVQTWDVANQILDPYKDLELHISGRVVATATRVPPKSYCDGIQNEESDRIHVFLSSDENPVRTSEGLTEDSFTGGGGAVGSRILLGTITGLGTSSEEGSCHVYNSSGAKTHVIMKHRTLLVKHMYWYELGEKVSVCECRCSRARLPPSKYWLFEPRCGTHDIGGWYIETFGRDKGRMLPSQRYWDGFDAGRQFEKRLHPAMYLLALAYRTLDLEDAKRRKITFRDVVNRRIFKILNWCKRLV